MSLRNMLRALFCCLTVCSVSVPALERPNIPATTREVVLAKGTDGHYFWQLVQAAPVPTPGDHQVLVHVRAVSVQHYDLDVRDRYLAGDPKDDSGQIVASDAAGEVVAVGKAVSYVHVVITSPA
jgi:NADPH:quinone reductase-like Zn-dependent oxidoreductase